jgi:cyclic-di-GMP phosphodiesterase, flagellum assembly factor TipF
MRFGAIFIAICMAIIAASAGAIVYLYLGVNTAEATAVAAGTFAALLLYNMVSTRVGLRSVVGRQIADLSRGGADVARQVAELGRRVAALEGKIETVADQARAVTDPLMTEVAEVGTSVKRLAETIEGQQKMLDALARAAPKTQTAEPLTGTSLEHAAASSDHADEDGATAAAKLGLDLPAIRNAVDANRIDLYLQPIVTLPQRKVRYYEATSRLRSERGETLHASAFIPQAESGGLMSKIDNLVTFRCVQLVRRLLLKNRDIGMFCNLSAKTLTDPTLFPQLLEFLAANRAIAPSLVLQFTHTAVAAMRAAEHEGLAAVSERGFHFSMDHLTSLRLDPAELANRGFRYIKLHASLLLKGLRPAPTDIAAAELSDRLGRFGIDLIVDRIEDERSVMDLLDHDVRFGQGSLFSPPRPVRPEALQAQPDLPDARGGEQSAGAKEVTPLRAAALDADPSRSGTETAELNAVAPIARGAVANG